MHRPPKGKVEVQNSCLMQLETEYTQLLLNLLTVTCNKTCLFSHMMNYISSMTFCLSAFGQMIVWQSM